MKHAREDYNRRIQDSENIIPADEPVFLIRARDVCALDVVRYWITVAKINGAKENIIAAAKGQLARMRNWQEKHGMKIPDMPEEEAVKNNGC